ncbi:uncharacterized protein F4807DRAFT_356322 [Annulohypoxylon truncatum]|uniref:uncharacterized protein n=1 Tax=Annulohypoxylon truncatum TaxID=327061 RepID=UPI002008227E|nr:uncharacterized protein F4807DRAFT_356322 [Annulohypoxylon truncatum]KAI1204244.1 hypothetical protein F4807DRAFT_356322 [Annulohypoxylon truncatum]
MSSLNPWVPGTALEVNVTMRLCEPPKLFCPLCSKPYTRTRDLMKHILWPDKQHSKTPCVPFAEGSQGPVQAFDSVNHGFSNPGLPQQQGQNRAFSLDSSFPHIAPSTPNLIPNSVVFGPNEPAALQGGTYGTVSQQPPQQSVFYPSYGTPTPGGNMYPMAPSPYATAGSLNEILTTTISQDESAANPVGSGSNYSADDAEPDGSGGNSSSTWEGYDTSKYSSAWDRQF